MALPGILYGNSFGSSDGLNPVLISPVFEAFFIVPLGN